MSILNLVSEISDSQSRRNIREQLEIIGQNPRGKKPTSIKSIGDSHLVYLLKKIKKLDRLVLTSCDDLFEHEIKILKKIQVTKLEVRIKPHWKNGKEFYDFRWLTVFQDTTHLKLKFDEDSKFEFKSLKRYDFSSITHLDVQNNKIISNKNLTNFPNLQEVICHKEDEIEIEGVEIIRKYGM